MGDQQHRDRQILSKRNDFRLQVDPGASVNSGKRLVEQQDFRISRERTRDGHPLSLATREFRWFAAFKPIEMDPGQKLRRPAAPLRLRMIDQGHGDIVCRGEVRKQGVFLKHQSDPTAMRRQKHLRLAVEPDRAVNGDMPGVTPIEPGNGAQKGGLACTRRTDNPQHFTRRAREGDIQGDGTGLAERDRKTLISHADDPRPRSGHWQ